MKMKNFLKQQVKVSKSPLAHLSFIVPQFYSSWIYSPKEKQHFHIHGKRIKRRNWSWNLNFWFQDAFHFDADGPEQWAWVQYFIFIFTWRRKGLRKPRSSVAYARAFKKFQGHHHQQCSKCTKAGIQLNRKLRVWILSNSTVATYFLSGPARNDVLFTKPDTHSYFTDP